MRGKRIYPFTVEGEFLDDSKMAATRSQYELVLEHEARDTGYVPVLDLDTHWTPEYAHDENRWFFTLTMYAVYVGKRKSWEYEGMSNNCLIPLQSGKQDQSSTPLE